MKRYASDTSSKTMINLSTYLPVDPDKNPTLMEKRVDQGGSGNIYPLPFTGRITEKRVNRQWKGLGIENVFLRGLILPERGGRIHAIQDKTDGDELIYNQLVIKPTRFGAARQFACSDLSSFSSGCRKPGAKPSGKSNRN